MGVTNFSIRRRQQRYERKVLPATDIFSLGSAELFKVYGKKYVLLIWKVFT